MSFLEQKLQKILFSRADQQAFLEDISALIRDGVPAPRAISTVYEIAKGPTKEAAKVILRKIAEGQKIADGMEGWFPQSIVEVVRSGEEGGMLAKALVVAVESLSGQASAVSSLLSSIAYPLTVLFIALGVSVFLKHSVFDNFATIKPMANWPSDGKMLLNLATFVERWWWLVLAMMAIIGVAIGRVLANATGEIRGVIDSLPLLSLYRYYAASRFMQTLGLLLNNGVGFKQALFIMQSNCGRYLAWHIYLMQYRLGAGSENIADVLDTGMVGEEDILRLRAMGKGKGFERALLSLGGQSLERTLRRMKVAGRAFGWLLMFIDASLAIFMIFAIYSVGSFVGT